MDAGRAARKLLPRGTHAQFRPPPDRDPLGLIAEPNRQRIPGLVPLRMGRMLASPFGFHRGTAALQIADLANFALFASPQRNMVFDLNDSGETAPGPWEWEVKRLVASVVVAGEHHGYSPRKVLDAATEAAASCRRGIREFLKLDVLERFHLSGDVNLSRGRRCRCSQQTTDKALKAGHKRTARRVVEKSTVRDAAGRLSVVEDPPTPMHDCAATEDLVARILECYRQSVPPDIFLLHSHCRIAIFEGPNQEPAWCSR